jgi:hypothetical protein
VDATALRNALRAQPFQPFVLRLADGREVRVPHPDFVAVSPRKVIVIHPDESWSVLEPLLIVSLEFATGAPTNGSQQGGSDT